LYEEAMDTLEFLLARFLQLNMGFGRQGRIPAEADCTDLALAAWRIAKRFGQTRGLSTPRATMSRFQAEAYISQVHKRFRNPNWRGYWRRALEAAGKSTSIGGYIARRFKHATPEGQQPGQWAARTLRHILRECRAYHRTWAAPLGVPSHYWQVASEAYRLCTVVAGLQVPPVPSTLASLPALSRYVRDALRAVESAVPMVPAPALTPGTVAAMVPTRVAEASDSEQLRQRGLNEWQIDRVRHALAGLRTRPTDDFITRREVESAIGVPGASVDKDWKQARRKEDRRGGGERMSRVLYRVGYVTDYVLLRWKPHRRSK
jgi:hypothetical protein